MQGQPKPTDFLSTKEYVIAFDTWAQKSMSNYSRRSFAKWAKIASPNFVTLICQGKRSLNGSWLTGFIKASKLDESQANHLQALSNLENTKDPKTRSKLLSDIQENLSNLKIESLAQTQLDSLINPTTWTIYHMFDLADQKPNPSWIKHRLRFLRLSIPEISKIITNLKSIGLLTLKEERLISQKKLIFSPDQIKNQTNALFHKYVLQEASEVIDLIEPTERSFGSMTATVQRDKIDQLKSEIGRFGKYITEKYASTEPVDGEVVRLNIQLYPLTSKDLSEK